MTSTATQSITTANSPRKIRVRNKFNLGRLITSLVVSAYILVTLVPIISILLGSFKPTAEVSASPLGLPKTLLISNYASAWNGVSVGESMGTYFLNTAIFSVAAIAVSTLAGTLAAYVIARRTGLMSAGLERYFLLLYALPFLAVIIPLFKTTGDLGIRSNPFWIGVVFAAGWLPLTVVLMTAFFAGFPHDVIEAAKTDGASEFRIFWTIAVPMSKGAILSNVLLTFIYAWNNLSHTLALLLDPKSTTVAPGLLLFSAQYSVDLGAQLAGMIISVLPLILAYLLLHKHIMESFRVGSFR